MRRSKIPVPVRRTELGSSEALMLSDWNSNSNRGSNWDSATEHVLFLLKAAKKDAFDHARKYHDCVEERVRSLRTVSFSPSIANRWRASDWQETDHSEESRMRNVGIRSSSSWVAAPESTGLRSSGDPSFTQVTLGSGDIPPPIPRRSSRRVIYGAGGREGLSSSASFQTGRFILQSLVWDTLERYVMPPSMLRNWMAVHRELIQRSGTKNLCFMMEVGPQELSRDDRDVFAPEQLNLVGG